MSDPADTPAACESFYLGHHVHWIQAKRSLLDGTPIPVTAITIDGHDVTLDLADGTQWRVWTHNTALLAASMAKSTRIEVRSHHVLAISSSDGTHLLLSMAEEPQDPCTSAKTAPAGTRWP